MPTLKQAVFAPNSESAHLLRRGITVATHDLVGIATAMELRLDPADRPLEAKDRDALRQLATQLRDATRTLRLLKGPDDDDALAPTRTIALSEWWRLCARLASTTLPRGSRIGTEWSRAEIRFGDASTLTQLWMLACEDLRQLGTRPLTIALRDESITADAERAGGGDRIRVTAELPADQLGSVPRSSTKWQRTASKLSAATGAQLLGWHIHGDIARWQCVLPQQR